MSKYVKSLEEFLSLDYKMTILPYAEEGEKGFIIKCPEIQGLEVFGETLQEALEEVKEAKIALFELYEKDGIKVKYPENYDLNVEDFSGRVTLRLPKNLHRRIKIYSDVNNISLNTGLIQLINDGINYGELKNMKDQFLEEINKLSKSSITLKVEYSKSNQGREIEPYFTKNKRLYQRPKFNFEEHSTLGFKQ